MRREPLISVERCGDEVCIAFYRPTGKGYEEYAKYALYDLKTEEANESELERFAHDVEFIFTHQPKGGPGQ